VDVRITPPFAPVESHIRDDAGTDAPDARFDDARALLRSTPVRLVVLGVVLTVLLVASAAVSATTVSGRQATHDRLLSSIEPLASAAQNLYSALSVADAAAVTGFISGGLEPEAVRSRYIRATNEAAEYLVIAATGLTDADRETAHNLTEIGRLLPVYTGLIETARTNNRTGHPVGAAYLGEASHLMQTELLPAAQELHTRGVAAVEDTQRDAVRPPWLAIGLLLVTVTALCVAHVVVSRRCRRTLNPGLLVAIGATGVLLCWLLVAGLASSSATEHAIERGAAPLADLTEGRILAQQSRTAETLLIARRDTTGAYDDTFGTSMARLGDILDEYGRDSALEAGAEAVEAARSAHDAWINSHARMVAALARGDYAAASVLAVGAGPGESTARFVALDAALTEGIDDTRTELRDNEFRASRTLAGLAPASVVLLTVALIGVWVGLRPRLKEYQ